MIGVAFNGDEESIKSDYHVYQWDTGQKLMVAGIDNLSINEVHFTAKGLKVAYVTEVESTGGTFTVDIPNKVLTYGTDITMYVCFRTETGNVMTIKTVVIPVIKRTKPENYDSGSDSGKSNVEFIDNISSFYCIDSIKSIIVPDGATSLAKYAFSNFKNLESVKLPNSVTSIGVNAFLNCTSLAKITIPNSVTSIGNYAFIGCTSLANITIPNSVTSIGDYAFSNCTSLANITIPDSVTSIGDDTFYGCTSLANITIPNGVTSIGNHTFYGCTSLANITIPNSVTSIGDATFYGCTSLESIIIPNSVTSIGNGALQGCTSLANIYYTGTEEQWNAIEKGIDWNSNVSGGMVIHYNSTV